MEHQLQVMSNQYLVNLPIKFKPSRQSSGIVQEERYRGDDWARRIEDIEEWRDGWMKIVMQSRFVRRRMKDGGRMRRRLMEDAEYDNCLKPS